ncbi:hypothetical protein V8J36_17225 [Frigidibacter sp. MR17.14]|uniref:hypothetical protein n=1 Tax=Frigidibacter sp. MR17.14 TaxID=3126509 RepID=UPI003012C157
MSFHDPKSVVAAPAAKAAAPVPAMPDYYMPEAAPAPEVKAIPALEQMFGYYA